jgi:hypothetical protein
MSKKHPAPAARAPSAARDRAIRIVPLCPPGWTGAPPRTAAPAKAPAMQLTYRGGALITEVEAVSVFWGKAWNDAAPRALAERLNGFLKFVVASPYIDQLSEYDTPEQAIGRGRFAGTATIDAEFASGESVGDGAIQQMLAKQVSARSVPAPTPNTLYAVFLPPGVAVVSGKDRSCQVFCGYHDRSTGGLFYAVLPYPDCAGCLGGLEAFEALTSVCSHEIAEAITDPVPGEGWYDDATGEIADICAWQNKKVGDYTVQKLWSNRAQACV